MTRPRGHLRGSAPARSKRELFWALGPGGDDIATMDAVSFTASATAILGSGVSPTSRFTIIRIHGYLQLALTAADAALSGFNWAFGLGIVTSDAFAVGVTAVPNPFDDADWPGWMWHQQGSLISLTGTIGSSQDAIQGMPIDVKSSRKLRLNEIVFASLQVGEIGTATMQARFGSRMLSKLP